jgi:hypothetical protein
MLWDVRVESKPLHSSINILMQPNCMLLYVAGVDAEVRVLVVCKASAVFFPAWDAMSASALSLWQQT